MDCTTKLIAAFEECGEAAAVYRGQAFLAVNRSFAGIFERDPADFEGMPIMEICHEESIDMIQDFIRRRAHEDIDVPTAYEAVFRSPARPRIRLKLIVLKLKKNEGTVLAIVREK